ncbi:MAG: hypothetical protein MJ203_00215, partial [archaeon]|nr:hypothetical protein [archaeon]
VNTKSIITDKSSKVNTKPKSVNVNKSSKVNANSKNKSVNVAGDYYIPIHLNENGTTPTPKYDSIIKRGSENPTPTKIMDFNMTEYFN